MNDVDIIILLVFLQYQNFVSLILVKTEESVTFQVKITLLVVWDHLDFFFNFYLFEKDYSVIIDLESVMMLLIWLQISHPLSQVIEFSLPYVTYHKHQRLNTKW